MKTVGKQLQEARLAKNWTPELAARETKIKVDRLGDLERDDYSHFTSPTYARGFVRTYARALGLDEYQILRQLDHKLPDDDSANIVTDTGVAYLPETAMPPRVAHRDFTGLYVLMGLGGVVTLVIVVVLFEAYRVGELKRYFAGSPETAAANVADTNATGSPAVPSEDGAARALPLNSDTPPPIMDAAHPDGTKSEIADASPDGTAPKALPVDGSSAPASTNADPDGDATAHALKALPVNGPEAAPASAPSPAPASPDGDGTNAAPRALPVNGPDSDHASAATAPPVLVAVNTPGPITPTPTPAESPAPAPVPEAAPVEQKSTGGPVMEPSMPAVAPSTEPVSKTEAAAAKAVAGESGKNSNRRLVLTASQDSFVKVTILDGPDADKPLYASVLHGGQSVGFDGHRFSIKVGVSSAVDIKLDGVNYGPHSDQDSPETFTVQSHQP